MKFDIFIVSLLSLMVCVEKVSKYLFRRHRFEGVWGDVAVLSVLGFFVVTLIGVFWMAFSHGGKSKGKLSVVGVVAVVVGVARCIWLINGYVRFIYP